MSNYSHLDYPAWARWVAKDEDGQCWVYEAEPHQFDRGWYENEVGRWKKVTCPQELISLNWKKCLKQL